MQILKLFILLFFLDFLFYYVKVHNISAHCQVTHCIQLNNWIKAILQFWIYKKKCHLVIWCFCRQITKIFLKMLRVYMITIKLILRRCCEILDLDQVRFMLLKHRCGKIYHQEWFILHEPLIIRAVPKTVGPVPICYPYLTLPWVILSLYVSWHTPLPYPTPRQFRAVIFHLTLAWIIPLCVLTQLLPLQGLIHTGISP